LTLEEVAEKLRVHPKTVRLMALRGEIPAFQVGRLWRFSAAKIENWIHGDDLAA
jgi:excisionase family DNA binding protein